MENNNRLVGCAGLPSSREWSQTSVFCLAKDEEGAVVVNLRSEDTTELLDLAMVGLELIEEVGLKVKEQSLKTLGEWEQYLTEVTTPIGEGVTVRIGVVLLTHSVVKVVAVGDIVATMLREGRETVILRGSQKVQGELLENDEIAITTSELKDALDSTSMSGGWQTEMEEVVRGEEASSMAGILVRRVQKKEIHMDAKKKLYVGEARNLKTYRLIGIVLLVVLIGLIAVGAWRRTENNKQTAYLGVKNEVTARTKAASEEAELDPEKARQDLDLAKLAVTSYQKQATGKYLVDAATIQKEIADVETSIFRQNEVGLSTWLELGILQLSQLPRGLVIGDTSIAYFPTDNGLVGLSIADKSQITLDIKMTKQYLDWVVVGKQVYALASDGIYGGTYAKGRELAKLADADEAWQQPVRLLTFGGSLYVLDTGTGEISKYSIIGEQLSARKRWFGKGIVLDLSKIVDVNVDGDMWLLSSSGKLERYSRGVPVKFEILGFANDQGEKKFSDPVAVATTETEVFVLERGESRVVVFDKNGKYSRQYVNPGFAEGKDLVIDGGKGYVLTDKEIKVFGL